MLLKEFKDNINKIILQSNSYEELGNEFYIFCLQYNLGKPGDDVFRLVLDKLEEFLKKEISNDSIS